MKLFEYITIDPVGLHARPASKLVRELSNFKSEVFIEYNGKKANGKSIINLMSLGIKFNSKIKFIITGDDEELCFGKLDEILKKNSI